MTSDDALKFSVANGLSKPGNIGFFEDAATHVPGAPVGVSLNDVIAAIARATTVADASAYWHNGWFQAHGLPYTDSATTPLQLWGLSSTMPQVGSVKILVTVRDDDKSTSVWGLIADDA